jgi:hypothetical protein
MKKADTTDKITNWYLKLDKKNQDTPTIDKEFNKHFILPNSRIALIGGSNAGKTNMLLEFLHRKNGAFYEVIIFTSNPDEPLLRQLKEDMEDIQIYSNINDVPDLKTFNTRDAKNEKLIVFDDFITLNKKDMKKVEEYAIASRKFGFTSMYMLQNYTSCPKIIMRQIEYFILFRLNDNVTINNIIKNHNVDQIPKEIFMNMYLTATSQPRQFFLLDVKNPDKKYRYRTNFTNLFRLTDYY